MERALVPIEQIEQSICVIRGQRVMLSTDLAALYSVQPRALVQAVKRNVGRFPPDFMFQLARQEYGNLKSQNVISSWGGARRATPYAFIEHGAIMAAMILNSPRAIEAGVYVIRAFVRLRTVLAEHKELARKLAHLEQRLATHDVAIREIVDAIRRLAALPAEPEQEKPKIGLRVKESLGRYRRK